MRKTPIRKISEKKKAKIEEEREARRKEYEVFEEIWKERHQRSEISNTWLGNEALSIYFDHLLEKSKYPHLRYEKENIILVTFAEHQKKTNGFPHPEHQRRIEEAKKRFLNNETS